MPSDFDVLLPTLRSYQDVVSRRLTRDVTDVDSCRLTHDVTETVSASIMNLYYDLGWGDSQFTFDWVPKIRHFIIHIKVLQ